MNTTLAERLKIAMQGPPKIKGIALAKACGVSGSAVSDWRTGETKTIEGSNLTRAADFLKVRAKWLAEGIGPMNDDPVVLQHRVQEPDVDYRIVPKTDPQAIELLELFSRLDGLGKAEFLSYMRGFVEGRRPHSYGRASKVAG